MRRRLVASVARLFGPPLCARPRSTLVDDHDQQRGHDEMVKAALSVKHPDPARAAARARWRRSSSMSRRYLAACHRTADRAALLLDGDPADHRARMRRARRGNGTPRRCGRAARLARRCARSSACRARSILSTVRGAWLLIVAGRGDERVQEAREAPRRDDSAARDAGAGSGSGGSAAVAVERPCGARCRRTNRVASPQISPHVRLSRRARHRCEGQPFHAASARAPHFGVKLTVDGVQRGATRSPIRTSRRGGSDLRSPHRELEDSLEVVDCDALYEDPLVARRYDPASWDTSLEIPTPTRACPSRRASASRSGAAGDVVERYGETAHRLRAGSAPRSSSSSCPAPPPRRRSDSPGKPVPPRCGPCGSRTGKRELPYRHRGRCSAADSARAGGRPRGPDRSSTGLVLTLVMATSPGRGGEPPCRGAARRRRDAPVARIADPRRIKRREVELTTTRPASTTARGLSFQVAVASAPGPDDGSRVDHQRSFARVVSEWSPAPHDDDDD